VLGRHKSHAQPREQHQQRGRGQRRSTHRRYVCPPRGRDGRVLGTQLGPASPLCLRSDLDRLRRRLPVRHSLRQNSLLLGPERVRPAWQRRGDRNGPPCHRDLYSDRNHCWLRACLRASSWWDSVVLGIRRVRTLGNGKMFASTVPVKVSGITTATQVAPGYEDVCAVVSTGTVECWGYTQCWRKAATSDRSNDYPLRGLTLEFRCLYSYPTVLVGIGGGRQGFLRRSPAGRRRQGRGAR
jgi:hypothetical protein